MCLQEREHLKKTETACHGSRLQDTPNTNFSKSVLSSADILDRIKSSNVTGRTIESHTDQSIPIDSNSSDSNLDLITDIRNYIEFGARMQGQATTKEIVSQFKHKLPVQQTINFKSMLKQICTFDRKLGIWTLKSEFTS